MVATVVDAKGQCSVGHKVGDSFEISCHNPAGLCGFFYHNIFPSLQPFQFGAIGNEFFLPLIPNLLLNLGSWFANLLNRPLPPKD